MNSYAKQTGNASWKIGRTYEELMIFSFYDSSTMATINLAHELRLTRIITRHSC